MRTSPKDSHGEDRLRHDLTDLLARVARPGRYVGGEFHVRRKPGASPRIVLSYPDVYEIGIANSGLQILYAVLNDATPAAAERAYCPWPDMATLMRDRGVPLWSLESGEPVRDAALWGFTLQHELTYTNILEMLDLAAVPLHAVERGEDDPIVLGGGPGSANPLPLTPFFDAFFVGEAEGRLGAIAAALEAPTRARRLEQLGLVPGVWLPHAAGGPAAGARPRVSRQVFMGFASTPPVTAPLVPLIEGVHDRAVIEVMRGCSSGCRFCQAGLWYRPVRERPAAMVIDAAERALRSTGCDEVSLISLSSCDYGGVREAVAGIRERFPHVRVSLPSLRVDSAAVVLARLGGEQRGSVTLAPEAGTQHLRDAINKRVDQHGLLGCRARRLRGRLQRPQAVLHGGPAGRDRRRRGGHRRHGVVGAVRRPLRGARPGARLDRRVVVRAQGAHPLRARRLCRRDRHTPSPGAAALEPAAADQGALSRRRAPRSSRPPWRWAAPRSAR